MMLADRIRRDGVIDLDPDIDFQGAADQYLDRCVKIDCNQVAKYLYLECEQEIWDVKEDFRV